MSVAVLGAGAFGTALAVALARDGDPVRLWARDAGQVRAMAETRENAERLPGVTLPDSVEPVSDLAHAAEADCLLLSVPMQSLSDFLKATPDLWRGKRLVACCKGVDLATGLGPSGLIAAAAPDAVPALLSGPSFAVDIANGLPTALTLASADETAARAMQERLSTAVLRLYRSTDMAGVELGGALKNVIAIACGMAIGAGLGESARAALMTRGYAEILRLAMARGAQRETLAGLSGLGDLVLTCTSEKSRNYAYGLRLGQAGKAETLATTEGIATARAVSTLAAREGLEMPITTAIAAVLDGSVTVEQAADGLLTRPLRPE
ncbi:NAD(P)H-dependent glycerol-3-phosphate dehydrogenase [Psychromarinibacter halotolerans]|uniref:Glycerol-3-phosphate dehydrogenase [NAD(P)+] n=1 Tax=Psychromarinibacter halotolerans TaxID=1775175 RepID=A0ABV7GR31_9RHOB|nr:NAD(P)H-dependent glycerol-3-phosphate dehydrogenase [Psychromarinibacter halotolerans]MDF0597897.1 NAD(P)-dependent glycerol-3-phosphate dehydrogenase [Psychromarinibacter halotolerans]